MTEPTQNACASSNLIELNLKNEVACPIHTSNLCVFPKHQLAETIDRLISKGAQNKPFANGYYRKLDAAIARALGLAPLAMAALSHRMSPSPYSSNWLFLTLISIGIVSICSMASDVVPHGQNLHQLTI